MTPEQYWAEIHQMGLTPTRFPTLFRTRDGEIQSVEDPLLQTAAQRVETIERIKFMVLGIEPVSKRQRDSEPTVQ